MGSHKFLKPSWLVIFLRSGGSLTLRSCPHVLKRTQFDPRKLLNCKDRWWVNISGKNSLELDLIKVWVRMSQTKVININYWGKNAIDE